ncbi:MAG: hypothetical protein LBU34_04300 [Planctomycetaceae bacterium]|jgi:predicted RNA binding protein YcfA (HicA-like mRNA interferase family)|nr:hypothetical protein [Planctomycetaceae bacterium]
MSTRKRTEIEKALSQKGFQLQENKDHRYYFFRVNGKSITKTKVSHGIKYKDLSDDLISQMAKQCRLSKNDFLKFIDCSMSQQQYENQLQQKNLLE